MAAPDPSPPLPEPGQPSMRLVDQTSALLLSVGRIDLVVLAASLLLCLMAYDVQFTMDYAALGLVSLVVAGRLMTPPDLSGPSAVRVTHPFDDARLLMEWCSVVGVLLLIGFALKVTTAYSRLAVCTWFVVAPVMVAIAYRVQRRLAARIHVGAAHLSRCVIVGDNRVSQELVSRLGPGLLQGYFDFRTDRRDLSLPATTQFLGHCDLLADYVRREHIAYVYITLPMVGTPRIKALIEELKDTTATVYFIPDIFSFDLIQARVIDINGLPALAVCDTPLFGINAALKRSIDVILSAVLLIVLTPLFCLISLAIVLTGGMPVFFIQKRYGLNGESISVYKFRTMHVMEEGDAVVQVRAGDLRVTPVGRLLRRTSFDELPQLLNVLQGSMSLVGPRPHAVVHNEFYRDLIAGYMLRHKVRPGITGWAQIHGLRGNTERLDQMSQRVQFDLDYLRRWSPWLDLKILVQTVWIVVRGDRAH